MTEFLKEKGIQFSKIVIFIDQLRHITCEIRKCWSFFDLFCSFLWADKSIFFQASEWLKETQSCWVWHLLWCENNLNYSMLCVKLVDPFSFFPFLSMFKTPTFEICYFKIIWMTEFLKVKGIQFSKILIFIEQLGHSTCEIRQFLSFSDLIRPYMWADKSNVISNKWMTERNSILLSLTFFVMWK